MRDASVLLQPQGFGLRYLPTYLLAVLSTATLVSSPSALVPLQEGGHVYVGVREDCFLHVVDLATYTVRQPYCARHL